MKVIEAKAEILRPALTKDAIDAIYKNIEIAGRTCYKSEDKITPNSARKFVRALVNSGHEAMIEHASMTVRFTVDRGVSHELVRHRLASLAQESTRYCVTGDTILRSIAQKRWTVEELYEWQNDFKRKGRLKLINLRSVDEKTNKIVANHVKQIFKVGEKQTYKLTTETGRTLICTEDHEIYTPNGYIKLEDLKINDTVYSNGKELLENEDWLRNYYLTQNHTRTETAKEIGCCESYVYRAFKKFGIVKPLNNRPNRKPGRGKKGAMSNEGRLRISERMKGAKNPLYKEDRTSLKIGGGYAEAHRKYDKNREKCEFCGSTRNIEIHHIDKNPIHNDENNVRILCSKCHKAVHKEGTIAVFPDRIVSIEDAGIRTVYDVQMEEPYHNFVANSIVVHNCSYNKEKFGNELTFIKPCFWTENTAKYTAWEDAMKLAERYYFDLLDYGAKPEEARSVLPNSLKTEVVVTADMREWRTIFKLRAAGTTGKPHPQMQEVMIPLLKQCQELMPELFDDIIIEGE